MRAGLKLAALVVLLAAPAAHAASPFQVAPQGSAPDVAVDGAGTAHVVWDVVVGSTQETHYCRILYRKRGCAAGSERVWAPPVDQAVRDEGDGPHVLLAGGRVIVVMSRCCAQTLYRFASPDGGVTFDAGAAIGTIGSSSVALGPSGIAVLDHPESNASVDPTFQMWPLDGPQATGETTLAPGVDTSSGQAIGFAPDGRPVAAWADSQSVFSSVAGPNPLDPAQWRPRRVGAGDGPALAGGPRRSWLLYARESHSQAQLVLRRFGVRSSAFGKPRLIRDAGHGALASDTRGEAHVVYTSGVVRYRRTSKRGRRLSRGRTIAGRATVLAFERPRLAVTRARGLVVWQSRVDGGTIGAVWLPRR
jgi:hypothetical protein